MTTNRDHIIQLREAADQSAEDLLLYKGAYRPGFHEVSDEFFYKAAKNEAYEKAVQVCLSANEYGFHKTCNECAEAIKSLKEESCR